MVMVSLDTEKSCYTAVKYLIDHGHRKIAMIGSSFLPGYYETTERGYRRALTENGIDICYDWVCNQCQNERDAYLFMEQLLGEKDCPTAVFAVGDIYAIGAMRCVLDRGFAVPDDFSFTGVDDIVLSKYISVPLTTVGYDKIDIGRLAMEQVMNLIQGKPAHSIVVPSDRLIERKSVKKVSL